MEDSVPDPPPFGSRYLTDETLVFEQNAWDHVPPPDDQDEKIEQAIARQRSCPVPDDMKLKYNSRPSYYWDIFYRNNQDNFFKDRNWLQREFPQLEEVTNATAGPKTVLEIGCGAGNAVFPLLSANKNPLLQIHACDYSKHAVRVVRSNPLYTNPPTGSVHASIWDLSSQTLPENLRSGSVDIIIMVFVMSALHPEEWSQAIANVYTLLRPGGVILMRDYGRHDLAQLRFKEARLLEDNFYVRGDGTRVYFFEPTELARLFTGSDIETPHDGQRIRTLKIVQKEPGVDPSSVLSTSVHPKASTLEIISTQTTSESATPDHKEDAGGTNMPDQETIPEDPLSSPNDVPNHPSSGPSLPSAFFSTPIPEAPSNLVSSPTLDSLPSHPLFTTVQLGVDRRLIVNRKRQLKMYRVWLQGEFRKNGDHLA